MAKKGYPWPDGGGFPNPPLWRGRHQRMGDTIPPSRPPGPPAATNSCPFSEAKPSGLPSGYYHDYARAMGYHEPPTVEKVNRPTYDLSSAADQIAEKDDAILFHWAGVGLALGTTNQIDLLDPGFNASEPTFYTGPEDATIYSGADVYNRCSNYVAIRDGNSVPILDPSTGTMVHVIDVLDSVGGTSLYSGAIRPSWNDVYPYGSFAIIGGILVPGPGSPSQITFEANTPPSGTPVAGAGHPVCFFNYSLFERILSIGGEAPFQSPFAISLLRTAGPLDTYDLNRDIAAAGWEKGDVVYTTFVAYRPTLILESAVPIPANVFVLGGATWPAGFGDAYRFMVGSRMVLDPWAVLPMPLEIAEPPSATLRSFDYANALIRARDGTMKGTVLFDAMGSGYSPGNAWDPFAGFLHRKLIEFTTPGQPTVLPFDAPCNLAAGTLTLTNPGDQFTDVVGNTHILPGIDLIELTDTASGDVVGLFVLSTIAGQTSVTVSELNGALTAAAVPAGTMRLYRSYFLSAADGAWSPSPSQARYRAAGVFVGEALGPDDQDQASPLVAFAPGTNHLLLGYNGPLDDRITGPGDLAGCGKILDIIGSAPSKYKAPGDIGFGRFDATVNEAWFLASRYRLIKGPGGGSDIRRFESQLWTDFDWDTGAGSWSGGHPTFRHVAYGFPNLAPGLENKAFSAFLQIEPDYENGIELGSLPLGTYAGVLFGSPGPKIFEDPTDTPDYGYIFTAPGDDPDLPMIQVGIHRDKASAALGDLWFRMREFKTTDPALPPTIDPAYCRFELSWDPINPVGRVEPKANYGWPTSRTFVHHCPLTGAEPLSQPVEVAAVNPLPPPNMILFIPDWVYNKPGGGAGSTEGWENWYSGTNQVNGDAAALNISVNLPDGAIIQYAYVIYKFEDAPLATPMWAWLDRQLNDYTTPVPYPSPPPPPDPAGSAVPVPANVLTGQLHIGTNPPGPNQTYDVRLEFTGVVGSNVVDNQNYSYTIHIKAGVNGAALDARRQYIFAVRVVYTMRDFLPA